MVVYWKWITIRLLLVFPAGGSVPHCGALYSLASNAPAISEICDTDGSTLIVRDDDREEVIRERLQAYEQQTPPVLTLLPEGRVCIPRSGSDARVLRPSIAREIEGLLPAASEKVAPVAGSSSE